jgi:hypothetical protein
VQALSDVLQWILGIGGLLCGGGVVGLLTFKSLNKKTNAEANQIASIEWQNLYKALSEKVDKLEVKVDNQSRRIRELENHIITNGLTVPE